MIQSVYIAAQRTLKGAADASSSVQLRAALLPTGFMASDLMQLEEHDESMEGVSLVHILNIIYRGKKILKPEDQLGKIEIRTYDGVQYVYNVDKVDESMPTLRHGEDIVITPKGPIWGEKMYIDMHYDLFDGTFRGSLRLDVDPVHSNVDDGIEEEVITSADWTGTLLVRVGRYTHATVAHLVVRLLSVDGSASQNVYGVISATNADVDHPLSGVLVFAKEPDRGIHVQAGAEIPLLRTRIAVPLDSEFHVDFGLNVNGVGVYGTETFKVRRLGLFPNITSQTTKNPNIQVIVEGNDDEELLTSMSNFDIDGEEITKARRMRSTSLGNTLSLLVFIQAFDNGELEIILVIYNSVLCVCERLRNCNVK
ncbi:hypothetical protein POM88_001591 [Heracleum sosnowskyi]|uniref:Uncharacterized protein n=1 Tax=Heracleum sosnowskyi TaxID=360622 RepID=A0AAD8NAZ3_9APIA|nr:hypothetical protein POM88_001591 [Heracleum sosnowskyi]